MGNSTHGAGRSSPCLCVNEHSFIAKVHKRLPPDVFRWKINDTNHAGVPDAMYRGPAGILFVEYKWLKELPKRSTTSVKIDVSPIQANWIRAHNGHGQKIAVITGTPDCALIRTRTSWAFPINNILFNELSVSHNDVATWITNVCMDGGDHYDRTFGF